tara:strand:- start:331 stop:852 length:522 start_codon:yes stop_codon:yes gene_type:complete
MALTKVIGSGISGVTVGNFITEVDVFRLTANQSGGTNADITSNLERVDDASFSKIGTGITESSGVFTFPSTGVYQVNMQCAIASDADANSMVGAQVSTNSGGAFDDVALANGGEGASSNSRITCYAYFFVNVTNASTFQVKFLTTSMGSNSYLLGDTAQNFTAFSFVRLGDSQ